MSYQVLARKWRPKTFDELAGQEHVLKALVNALENQRLHHAYLFTGTRGVGKTTIARILARSLNCETGITSTPCGTCSACQEINDGRFVDLIEVDAASRTKVEDTRDLLENVQYRPTRGRFKIYLIDEVHMLSSHSFNALLKTLEEPPEHVKFLLATTDPQKLPVTVLSRCLQFNLKNLTSARIQEQLNFVLGEEKVPSDPEALWHLARAARGSMRDALSLTDQAISHGGGKLSEGDVVSMLGTVDRKRIYDLMDALKEGDAERLLSIAAELAEFSPDYFTLIEEILGLIHAVALYQHLPESGRPEDFDQEKLAEYATSFSPEDVQLLYQMLLLGQKDIAITPELHMGFEMLLLRLLAFQPLKMGERLPETSVASAESEHEGNTVKKPEAALASSQRTLESKFESSADGDIKPSESNSFAREEPKPQIEAGIESEIIDFSDIPQLSSSKPEAKLKAEAQTKEKVDVGAIRAKIASEESQAPELPETQLTTVNPEKSEFLVAESENIELLSGEKEQAYKAPNGELNAEQSQSQSSNSNSQELKNTPDSDVFDNHSSAIAIENMGENSPENSPESTAEHSNDEDEQAIDAQSMDEIYEAYSSVSETVEDIVAETGLDAIQAVANLEAPQIIHSIVELDRGNWIAVFNQLPLNGMVRSLCSHLVFDRAEADNLYFMLAAPGQKIFEETHKEKLHQALIEYFSDELNIHVIAAEVDQETPAECAERLYLEALSQAEEEILASTVVQKLVEEFDAVLVKGSVKLIDSDRRLDSSRS